MQPRNLSNLFCFLQKRNCRKIVIIVTNYDTSLVSGMYILKENCYLTTSVTAIHFLMVVPLFYGSTWSNPFVKDTVFISQHFLQPSIITSGLWLIQENVKGVFIWEKPYCRPAFLFHRTTCRNFCLKSTVLNAQRHLQPSHFNLAISQQQLQLSIRVNFLEEQLYTFALARAIFGIATFSKELAFRSTYSLNFLSEYYSFW